MFDSIVDRVSSLWGGEDHDHDRRHREEEHEDRDAGERHAHRSGAMHQEEGDGIFGFIAHTVREAGSGAADLVRRAAPVLNVALNTPLINAEEIAEEMEDASRGVAEHVDEDLRQAVDNATGNAVPVRFTGNRQFRLEDEQRQRNVEQRTRTLFDGIDGAGTDPALIRRSLRGADAETIRAMRAEFARTHGGRDMFHELDMDLSGSMEDEVDSLLTGDPVEQALATIDGTHHGISSDGPALEAAIRSVPAARRAEVVAAMGGEQAAARRLAGEQGFSGDGRVQMALLENREADAVAYRLDDELNNGILDRVGRELGIDDLGGVDRDSLYRRLESIPESRREAVIQAYNEMPHRQDSVNRDGVPETLNQALTRELDPGAERNRALALAAGNRELADAHALQLAADEPWYESEAAIGAVLLCNPVTMPIGVGILIHSSVNETANGGLDTNSTDSEAMFRIMERRPRESGEQYAERIGRTRAYFNNRHGHDDPRAFDRMLRDELGEGTLDHQRARSLIEHDGVMDWQTQLEYACERRFWSTDEDMAVRAVQRAQESGALDRMSTEERRALRERLIDGPLSEMDGRPALQVEEALEGPPESPEEWVRFWERRHELDRDTLGAGIVDAHSSSGRDYDQHLTDLRALVGRDGQVRPEDQARFAELMRTLGGDQGSYRTRQDETTDVAVQAAATAATVAVMAGAAVLTCGTSLTLSPAVVAGVAALAGGSAGMGMRAAMQGDAYEREDILQDGVRTGVSALAAGVTQTIQLGAPMTSFAARAASAIPAAQLGMTTDLMLNERELEWGDVGRRGLQAGGEVLGTGLGDTVEDAIGGANPSLALRMLASGTGGAVDSATGATLDPGTYEHGGVEALGRIGGRALQGGATSSLLAVTEHVHAAAEARTRHSEERARFDETMRVAAERGTGDDPVVELPRPRRAPEPEAAPDTGRETLDRLGAEHDTVPDRIADYERQRRVARELRTGQGVETDPDAVVDLFDPPHVEVDEPSLSDLTRMRSRSAPTEPEPVGLPAGVRLSGQPGTPEAARAAWDRSMRQASASGMGDDGVVDVSRPAPRRPVYPASGEHDTADGLVREIVRAGGVDPHPRADIDPDEIVATFDPPEPHVELDEPPSIAELSPGDYRPGAPPARALPVVENQQPNSHPRLLHPDEASAADDFRDEISAQQWERDRARDRNAGIGLQRDMDRALANVRGIRDRGFPGQTHDAAETMPAGAGQLGQYGNANGQPVVNQGGQLSSSRTPGANGQPDIVRVGTNEQAVVNDGSTLVTTDLGGCDAVVLTGTRDGEPMTALGHVHEDDEHGPVVRLNDAAGTQFEGADDVQATVVPGAEAPGSHNQVPDNAVVTMPDGSQVPMRVLRRRNPEAAAHVLVNQQGIAVFEGDRIENAEMTRSVAHRRAGGGPFEHYSD